LYPQLKFKLERGETQEQEREIKIQIKENVWIGDYKKSTGKTMAQIAAGRAAQASI
jgi:hypothetical protein